MIKSHFNKSRWPVIIGLVLQIVAIVIQENRQYLPLWWVLLYIPVFILGTVLLARGISEYAKAKGRDPALGWLALLSLLGVLVVGSLPDLTRKSPLKDHE